jgi:hypothetical protein
MTTVIILNPPKAVDGHPIEIMEIHAQEDRYLITLRLRITTAENVVECFQRFDRQKRITLDTIVGRDEAYRLLLVSRGLDPFNGPNPLAEAVEESLARAPRP